MLLVGEEDLIDRHNLILKQSLQIISGRGGLDEPQDVLGSGLVLHRYSSLLM